MNEHNPTISKGIDWTLAWIYLLLVAVGITAIFAVTYKESDPIVQSFFGFKTDYSKQFYFFLASAVIGIFILLTDSKFFTATANKTKAFANRIKNEIGSLFGNKSIAGLCTSQ